MLRKYSLLIVIITFTMPYIWCNVNLSGKVFDEANIALVGAKIEETSTNVSTATTTDGSFTLSIANNQEVEIKVSAKGYVEKLFVLKTKNENIKDFHITLSRGVNIDEITVTANSHIEGSRYAIHIPSKIEKKHSNSGYSLISVMNLPDLKADHRSQSITNLNGQQLVMLINGIEADANQITTLRPQDILRVEYQRVPLGKWATSAGIVNFVVKQWEYGGNFLASADECIGYQSGNYLTYFNYAYGNTTFAATLNGKWTHNKDVGSFGTESFNLNSIQFSRERNNLGGETKENSQSAQFMLQNITEGHRFKGSLLLSRKATPKRFSLDELKYVGAFEDMSTLQYRESDQSALSPTLTVDYTKYFSQSKSLNINSEISYSHSDYNSIYQETNANAIYNNVIDNTLQAACRIDFQTSMPHNIYLTSSIAHSHSIFKDKYSGSSVSSQDLSVGNSAIRQQFYHIVNNKFYYYILAGLSNYYTRLNEKTYNYIYPIFYFGLNYTFSPKNSLSFKGHYSSTNYTPTYKNETTLQNSFFEYSIGNPELKATKVYQQDLSYNTTINKVKVSAMYQFLAYFDNTFNVYNAIDNKLYQQMSNEGNFFSNKAILSATWNSKNDKLRLGITGYFDHINTSGGIYCNSINRAWADANVRYIFKDFMIYASYSMPHTDFWINGPFRGTKNDSYVIELSWQKGAWNASVGALNFLETKRGVHRYYDYGVYSTDMRNYSRGQGRNIFVTLSYSINFGRKTDKGNPTIQSKTTDAIMRTF